MYFPIGWPKVVKIPDLGRAKLRQIVCNRDKILFAILSDDSLSIWFCKVRCILIQLPVLRNIFLKPCVPIVFHRRSPESLQKFGANVIVEWKPDSSRIVVAVSFSYLYKIQMFHYL